MQLPCWPPEQLGGGNDSRLLAVEPRGRRLAAACQRDRLALFDLGSGVAGGGGTPQPCTWARRGSDLLGLAFVPPAPAPAAAAAAAGTQPLPQQQQQQQQDGALAVLLRPRGAAAGAPCRLVLLGRQGPGPGPLHTLRELDLPLMAPGRPPPSPGRPHRRPDPAWSLPVALLAGPPGSGSLLAVYSACLLQLWPDRPRGSGAAAAAEEAAADQAATAAAASAAVEGVAPPQQARLEASPAPMDWEAGSQGTPDWEPSWEQEEGAGCAGAAARPRSGGRQRQEHAAALARGLSQLPCAAALVIPPRGRGAGRTAGAALAGGEAASEGGAWITAWAWEQEQQEQEGPPLGSAAQHRGGRRWLVLGLDDGTLCRVCCGVEPPQAQQKEQGLGQEQEHGRLQEQGRGQGQVQAGADPPGSSGSACGRLPAAAGGLAPLPDGRLFALCSAHSGESGLLLRRDAASGRYACAACCPPKATGAAACAGSCAHVASAAPVQDCLLADLEGLRQNQLYLACAGAGRRGCACGGGGGGGGGGSDYNGDNAAAGPDDEGEGERASHGGRLCVLYPDPRPETVLEVPGAAEVRHLGGCCGRGQRSAVLKGGGGVCAAQASPTPSLSPLSAQGLTGLWGLRASAADPRHALVLLSHVGGSRLLAARGGTFSDATEGSGIAAERQTLAAGSVAGPWSAQVTPGGVLLFNAAAAAAAAGDCSSGGGPLAAAWTPPPGASISTAAVAEGWVLLQLSGSRQLLALAVAAEPGGGGGGAARLVHTAALPIGAEVSCFSNLVSLGGAISSAASAASAAAVGGAGPSAAALLAVGTYAPGVLLLRLAWDEASASGRISRLAELGPELLSPTAGSGGDEDAGSALADALQAVASGDAPGWLSPRGAASTPRAAAVGTPTAGTPTARGAAGALLSPRSQQRQREQQTPESLLLLPLAAAAAAAPSSAGKASSASLLVGLRTGSLLQLRCDWGGGGGGAPGAVLQATIEASSSLGSMPVVLLPLPATPPQGPGSGGRSAAAGAAVAAAVSDRVCLLQLVPGLGGRVAPQPLALAQVLKAAPLLLDADSAGSGGGLGARGGGAAPAPPPQLFLLCAAADGCLRMAALGAPTRRRALPLAGLAPTRLALHSASDTLALAGTVVERDSFLAAAGIAGARPLVVEQTEVRLVDPVTGECGDSCGRWWCVQGHKGRVHAHANGRVGVPAGACKDPSTCGPLSLPLQHKLPPLPNTRIHSAPAKKATLWPLFRISCPTSAPLRSLPGTRSRRRRRRAAGARAGRRRRLRRGRRRSWQKVWMSSPTPWACWAHPPTGARSHQGCRPRRTGGSSSPRRRLRPAGGAAAPTWLWAPVWPAAAASWRARMGAACGAMSAALRWRGASCCWQCWPRRRCCRCRTRSLAGGWALRRRASGRPGAAPGCAWSRSASPGCPAACWRCARAPRPAAARPLRSTTRCRRAPPGGSAAGCSHRWGGASSASASPTTASCGACTGHPPTARPPRCGQAPARPRPPAPPPRPAAASPYKFAPPDRPLPPPLPPPVGRTRGTAGGLRPP